MAAAAFEMLLAPAEALDRFSNPRWLAAMLAFEAALARAQASCGLIPSEAGEAIAALCRADDFDAPALVAASHAAGSLAIPLVKALTARAEQRAPAAAPFVHFGSTSQDLVDTALLLCTRPALARVDAELTGLIDALTALASESQGQPLLGRTLMQPAQVISVDFKLLSWVAPLVRGRERLRRAAEVAMQLQLGGAVGTRAMLGAQGRAVAEHMAQALGLRAPAAAWHSQRDEFAELACALGLLAGSLGKIAGDIALHGQAEVGELSERPRGAEGGSSAMPHKRNPVGALVALAAAQRAPLRVAGVLGSMGVAHERGLGDWQAEGAEFAGLLAACEAAVTALHDTARRLSWVPARLDANIAALHGLVFSEAVALRLAPVLGRLAAQDLIERLSAQALAQGRPLLDLLLAQALLPEAELRQIFDPAAAAAQASALAAPQWLALKEMG